MISSEHPETLCVHAGYQPAVGGPRIPAICQSTTFLYDSAETLGALFNLQESGDFYTRLGNPTASAAEGRIAALEGGVGALLTSSGQAASLFSVLNICKAGDHVIASTALYGGTYNLFSRTMREMGIAFTFVDPEAEPEVIQRAFRPDTRAVFAETLSNPTLVVLDIRKFAKLAHDHGVPLIVDNTFPTPVNCKPLAFGADIVIHSATKYMDGHATSLGGVIVDGGTFDWSGDKYPGLTQPDPSYHGLVFTEAFGKAAYIAKARTHLMRDIGATPAPLNAFLINLGLETLPLRIERHCSNALAVAAMLQEDAHVAWVNYPGLKSSRYYERARVYMPKGTCGVVTFGIRGGYSAAQRFMEKLRLAAMVIHVADARTCVLHPASTTHRQLNDAERLAAHVSPEMIRLSVGIEHIDDILADLKQALED